MDLILEEDENLENYHQTSNGRFINYNSKNKGYNN